MLIWNDKQPLQFHLFVSVYAIQAYQYHWSTLSVEPPNDILFKMYFCVGNPASDCSWAPLWKQNNYFYTKAAATSRSRQRVRDQSAIMTKRIISTAVRTKLNINIF